MRKFNNLFLLLATLIVFSCDNRFKEYQALVNEADSIVFSYNIEGRYQEAQTITDSSSLQNIKEILNRRHEISVLNNFIGSTKIQLYNNGDISGTVEISEAQTLVNFTSNQIEFGSGLTYGLGQYVGESRNAFQKEIQYINHQTLVLPNTLSENNKPTFTNIAVDTTELFGIWTVDPEGPHADFWLTEESYYIVDYDGNGHIPYILEDRTLSILYPEGKRTLQIISTSNDSLVIRSEYDTEITYTRWKE